MMTVLRVLFIVAFASINHQLFSQGNRFDFRQMDENQGLPGNSIRSIFQGSNGLLWFGVEGIGLCRYDGYNYNVYAHDPNDSSSIGNNFIDAICEGENGDIWVGTNNGVYRLNRHTGKFKPYLSSLKEKRNEAVKAFLVDENNTFWLGSNVGFYRYEKAQDKFVLISFPFIKQYGKFSVLNLTEDSHHNIWIASSIGVIKYNAQTQKSKLFRDSFKDSKMTPSNYIICIQADKNDNLWVGSSSHFFVIDSLEKFHVLNRSSQANLESFLPEVCRSINNNQIWTGGISLSIYNTKTLKKEPIPLEVKEMFRNADVRCFFEDKEGQIWIGTKSKGIFIHNPTINTFPYWGEKKDNYTEGLSDKVVTSVCEDAQNNLWIGTRNGGINRFDPKTKKFTVYKNKPRDINSLPENYIVSLENGENGTLWASTIGFLVNFNFKTNTFKRYPFPLVMVIFLDNQKNLWLGTRGGVLKFDAKTGKAYADEYINKKYPFLAKKDVSVIYQDKDGYLWIGWTTDGLLRYHPQKKMSDYFYRKENDSTSLSDNTIRSIYQDKKGRIWVGTKAQGLNLFDPRTKGFIRFGTHNNLPSNSIYSILEDSSGNLWMGTHNGIAKFNPQNNTVETFTHDYGLQSNIFSQRAHCMCKTGELFMGGNNGFNLFRPSKVKKKHNSTSLIINSIKVLDKVWYRDLTNDTIIKLKYNQNYLSFNFSLLDFSAPYKNQYKYQMENVNSDWIIAGNQNYVSYSGLKPGQYTFKVTAANSEGEWTNKVRSIVIIISPPWWNTWLARILFISFFVILVYSLYSYRISLLKKREDDLQHLVQKRTEELSLSNELLIEQQSKMEKQSEELTIINEQLLDRQSRIEAQTEELRNHSERLKEANNKLIESNELIQEQSKLLQESNRLLEISNSAKDKFFSIIAHDLRNPFHVVLGFSDIILHGLDKLEPEKIRKYTELIHSSALQGNNLLENLLQWSRSQTGRITFEPETLNISELINDTIAFLEGGAQRKNISLVTYIAPDLMVKADVNMLKTVIRNLLSNAIKFTPNDGTVTIKAGKLANIVIEITDTGVGIPAENLQKLFRLESTVSTKGTQNESGTGLGLVLCREFIERHGGYISAESELDKGSTFRIYLPC
jgi:signal transduction histidine kinase/ligand-binding sensor domain-containing protein